MIKVGDKVRYTQDDRKLQKSKIYQVEKTFTVESSADHFIFLVGEAGSYNALDFDVVPEPETAAPAILPKTAAKNDQGKLDLSLIPYVALRAEAIAFMVGERKYGRYNYTKGHKASQLVAAAMRHMQAWFEGEENDPADGQPHLGSVRACMSMILRQQELGTLKDDRFTLPQGTEV